MYLFFKKYSNFFLINNYFNSFRKNLFLQGDKSLSHRFIFFSLFFEKNIILSNLSLANDCLNSLNTILLLNKYSYYYNNYLYISKKKNKINKKEFIYCGDSATTIRILPSFSISENRKKIFYGSNNLMKRPIERIENLFCNLNKKLVVKIIPFFLKNKISRILLFSKINSLLNNNIILKINSAQVKSYIIIISFFLNLKITIKVNKYLRDHTERVLLLKNSGNFFISNNFIILNKKQKNIFFLPKKIFISSCISSSSFFFLFSILFNFKILLKNLNFNYTRTGLIESLRKMGAIILIKKISFYLNEPLVNLLICPSLLSGYIFSGNIIIRMIDEIQTLLILSSQAIGYTIIKNCGELKYKEINRIKYSILEYKKFGILVYEINDGFLIKFSHLHLSANSLNSREDHRLAINLKILCLYMNDKNLIINYNCYKDSFLEFDNYINLFI